MSAETIQLEFGGYINGIVRMKTINTTYAILSILALLGCIAAFVCSNLLFAFFPAFRDVAADSLLSSTLRVTSYMPKPARTMIPIEANTSNLANVALT